MILAPFALTLVAAASPFDDAVAVWRFADASDSSPPSSSLESHGAVRLGVVLEGEGLTDSPARGGSGRAARFDGGWLDAGQGGGEELRLGGNALTVAVRLRLDPSLTDSPILSKHGGHGALAYNLFVTTLGGRPSLGFELGLEGRERPLQVSVPLEDIGVGRWWDIVARFTGPRLELFVDGVLVDEEWPIGELRDGNTEPCLLGGETHGGVVKSGLHGWMALAALWSRAVSDEEIELLAGGPERVASREAEILGTQRDGLAYWRPRGHNASAGDCMPFYHDGTFHLFYLFDRRRHGSKWGLGAHQWAHASSRDLVHWTHHPMAVGIEEQWECSICTGSVIEHAGVFHAFYATRDERGEQHLGHAESLDCVSFAKQEPNPFLSAPEGYDPQHLRDPFVFRGDDGQFHMLVTARLTDGRDGCLAHLVSSDLDAWQMLEPYHIPGRVTDCPDTFEWNGWHYLLAEFVYWVRGPGESGWRSPVPDRLDTLYVPKTAPFTGGRRIYVSWLGDSGWGGDLVFRELGQLPDGRLTTRFVPEMVPHGATPRPLPRVACDNGSVTLAESAPALRFRGLLTPTAGTATYGLCLPSGASVALLPLEGAAEIRGGDGSTLARIDHVEAIDSTIAVEVVAIRDIVDVCIGDRRTLIARVGRPAERGDLALLADRGGCAVSLATLEEL